MTETRFFKYIFSKATVSIKISTVTFIFVSVVLICLVLYLKKIILSNMCICFCKMEVLF